MAEEFGGIGRDSTELPGRTDLAMRGDCLGLRDTSREARPTIFLAELSMTREVLTGDVATGVDATPAGKESCKTYDADMLLFIDSLLHLGPNKAD